MIIDCHCHAGIGDRLTAPWNTDASLTRYLKRARRAGISHTLVWSAFHSDYAVANRAVARVVQEHPGRLTGFAFIHCGRDAGRIRELVEEAVMDFGFRGIKVHGMDHPLTREACEVAELFKLPVLVDVFGDAHVVDMFAPLFPRVNFIIPHLGSFADDFKAQQQVVIQAARYPNVFADSSAVRRFDYLVQLVQLAGPRKLLFGSDGPWLHPGVELHKIRMLRLNDSDERLVLSGNVRRLVLDRKPGVFKPMRSATVFANRQRRQRLISMRKSL